MTAEDTLRKLPAELRKQASRRLYGDAAPLLMGLADALDEVLKQCEKEEAATNQRMKAEAAEDQD